MDPSSLYASNSGSGSGSGSVSGSNGPSVGLGSPIGTSSLYDSLKRKRSSPKPSQSAPASQRSHSRTPSSTPTPDDLSINNSNNNSSKPSVRFQSPHTDWALSIDQPLVSTTTTAAAATPTPTPTVGKAGWPKGKPRGKPKPGGASTSNSKSKSNSASAREAREAAAAAQAQREAEAAARELEEKERLALEAIENGAYVQQLEEEDTKLYCICKTLYDESKMMIACDTCDEWYHIGCMGISERQAELIDMFICTNCETDGQQTTYKPPCLRTDCTRAALPPLSRYCSERCGLLMASARILKTKYAGKDAGLHGGIERLLSGRVRTARRKEGIVIWGNESSMGIKKEGEKIEGVEENGGDKENVENLVKELEILKNVEESSAEGVGVGEEWFGKFGESWGNERSRDQEVPHFEKSNSNQMGVLEEIKNLSLNVDGVDRNLLKELFPFEESDRNGDFKFNSTLNASSTKSEEEFLTLRKRFIDLLKRKEKVNVSLDSIQARSKLLQLAEDRTVNLEPVKISEEITTGSKKTKKGKSKSKSKETETGIGTEEEVKVKITTGPPCGYDSRLNWDEERFWNWCNQEVGKRVLEESLELDGVLWEDWDDVVEDGLDVRQPYVCKVAKRKCKRHVDWSMVRGADFEVEKEVQTNLLSQLSLELSNLRERISNVSEAISAESKASAENEIK